MEIVFAAIIWNAQAIHYAPMSRARCEAFRMQSIIGWHPRIEAPVVECLRAKWTCEHGFQFLEDE